MSEYFAAFPKPDKKVLQIMQEIYPGAYWASAEDIEGVAIYNDIVKSKLSKACLPFGKSYGNYLFFPEDYCVIALYEISVIRPMESVDNVVRENLVETIYKEFPFYANAFNSIHKGAFPALPVKESDADAEACPDKNV